MRPKSLSLACVVVVGVTFLSGCQHPADAATVGFLTEWSASGHHFIITSEEDLPDDLSVTIVEQGSEVRETFGRDELTETRDGTWRLASDVTLQDAKTYYLEASAGGRSLGSREILVRDREMGLPPTAVRATYRLSLDVAEDGEEETRRLKIQGTAITDVSATRERLHMDGTGSMDMTAGEMRMTLDITTFRTEERDDVRTTFLLEGDGTWEWPGLGAGELSMRSELVGRESKEDGAGVPHETEKTADTMSMSGIFTFGDEETWYEMDRSGHEWSRVDNDETIWESGEETTTVTAADGTSETTTEEYDRPVDEEDADTDLMDILELTGLTPHPIRPGDRFRLNGLEGVTVDYVVMEGDTREVAGRSFPTWSVEGTMRGGVQGSERFEIVANGDLAGLPISATRQGERDGERLTMRMDLTSVV